MTVTFPIPGWLPNPDQLQDSGATLLGVVADSLDQLGSPNRNFQRRLFTHGETALWIPDADQIVVSLAKVYLGRAGEEQYQFDKGVLGKYGFVTLAFDVAVVHGGWPTVEGGIGPRLPEQNALMSATSSLWHDGWVAFSALRALALGGITTTPPVCPIVQDNVMVGPMSAKGPSGKNAGLELQVLLQV